MSAIASLPPALFGFPSTDRLVCPPAWHFRMRQRFHTLHYIDARLSMRGAR